MHGCPGGYIGLPPRGTMVNRSGVGLGRQCLLWPASPLAAGARRLVGPAGCLVLGRQAAPAACGSCRLLIIVAVLLMTLALSREAWLQSCHLAVIHCSHSLFLPADGAQTLKRGRAACWKPASPQASWPSLPPSGFPRDSWACRLRAVPIALHGNWAPSVLGDVMGGGATVPCCA